MVYCRKCRAKVEDCTHFVPPLNGPPTEVFDPKVKTLAYKDDARILEIAFKNGQVWQLFGVPPVKANDSPAFIMNAGWKGLLHEYNFVPNRI